MADGGDVDVKTSMGPVESAGQPEARLHIRAYHVWARYCRKGRFPLLDDVLAAGAADFGSRALCIDVSAGPETPRLTYVGAALAQTLSDPAAIRGLADIPGRSLISRMTDHYLEIVANRAPISFEAEFVDDRECAFQYRCILLPCSYSGTDIDVILGVMNWQQTGGRIVLADPLGAGAKPLHPERRASDDPDAVVQDFNQLDSSGPDDVRKEGGSIVTKGGRKPMSIETNLQECMEIDGAVTAALVDYQSGMALATAGNSRALNLEVAAAGNTNVVRAKMQTIKDLGLKDEIEDMLITLSTQYHLIRPCASDTGKGLFIYLVLEKARANLAMARFKLGKVEKALSV